MQKCASSLELKRPSLQALKHKSTSPQAFLQGFKLQARVHKLQDPGTRVQAKVPKLQGTSNKDKGIFWMFHMKRNLVRR